MSCTVGVSITQARMVSIAPETQWMWVYVYIVHKTGGAGTPGIEFNSADPSARLCWRSGNQGRDTTRLGRLIQHLCPHTHTQNTKGACVQQMNCTAPGGNCARRHVRSGQVRSGLLR